MAVAQQPSASLLARTNRPASRAARKNGVASRRGAYVAAKDGREAAPAPFTRSPAQQAIKDIDTSVQNAKQAVGASLMGVFGPLFGGASAGGDRGAAGPGGRRARQLGPEEGAAAVRAMAKASITPKGWVDTWQYLVDIRLRGLGPQQAADLMAKQKWVLLDVRPADEYAAHHAEGSLSLPLYQNITGSSPMQLLRAVAFQAQGVKPSEINDQFLADAAPLLAGARGVIVACSGAGFLKPTSNFPNGKASRSLLAAALLAQGGIVDLDKVAVLANGGLNAWFKAGFPGEGTAEAWEDTSGRNPPPPGWEGAI